VGASEGVHDEGRGEVEDVLAAAAWVRQQVPEGPFVLGGFSFGSVAALDAAPTLAPQALLLIGLPLRRWSAPVEAPFAGQVVWVQGSEDEFADAGSSRVLAERWGWDLHVVPGADHFFAGKLNEFEREAGDGLARMLEGAVR
jgi:alpha/beta superfamily hydrolase